MDNKDMIEIAAEAVVAEAESLVCCWEKGVLDHSRFEESKELLDRLSDVVGEGISKDTFDDGTLSLILDLTGKLSKIAALAPQKDTERANRELDEGPCKLPSEDAPAQQTITVATSTAKAVSAAEHDSAKPWMKICSGIESVEVVAIDRKARPAAETKERIMSSMDLSAVPAANANLDASFSMELRTSSNRLQSYLQQMRASLDAQERQSKEKPKDQNSGLLDESRLSSLGDSGSEDEEEGRRVDLRSVLSGPTGISDDGEGNGYVGMRSQWRSWLREKDDVTASQDLRSQLPKLRQYSYPEYSAVQPEENAWVSPQNNQLSAKGQTSARVPAVDHASARQDRQDFNVGYGKMSQAQAIAPADLKFNDIAAPMTPPRSPGPRSHTATRLTHAKAARHSGHRPTHEEMQRDAGITPLDRIFGRASEPYGDPASVGLLASQGSLEVGSLPDDELAAMLGLTSSRTGPDDLPDAASLIEKLNKDLVMEHGLTVDPGSSRHNTSLTQQILQQAGMEPVRPRPSAKRLRRKRAPAASRVAKAAHTGSNAMPVPGIDRFVADSSSWFKNLWQRQNTVTIASTNHNGARTRCYDHSRVEQSTILVADYGSRQFKMSNASRKILEGRGCHSFEERNRMLLRKKAERAAQRRDPLEDELKECTWQPKINAVSRQMAGSRSATDLLLWAETRQARIWQKQQEKKKEIADEIVGNCTFRPAICEKSRSMKTKNVGYTKNIATPVSKIYE